MRSIRNCLRKDDGLIDSSAQALHQKEGKKLFIIKILWLLCDEYVMN